MYLCGGVEGASAPLQNLELLHLPPVPMTQAFPVSETRSYSSLRCLLHNFKRSEKDTAIRLKSLDILPFEYNPTTRERNRSRVVRKGLRMDSYFFNAEFFIVSLRFAPVICRQVARALVSRRLSILSLTLDNLKFIVTGRLKPNAAWCHVLEETALGTTTTI